MESTTISEMNTVIKKYDGYNISFSKGEDIMINATEMAKPFGKRPVDWMQNQQTKDFLAELSKVRKSTLADLVRVTKGGNNPGTWMHEDVALEFARWLSPKFAIWCNDRIKELLLNGTTSINNIPDFNDPVAAARAWADEKEKSLKLEAEKAEQQKQIEVNKPKVAFADAITSSSTSCLIGELAKLIKQAVERNGGKIAIGQNRFFQWLRNNGYLGKSNGYRNVANQEYIEQGLFELKKTVHDENGVLVSKTTTKVTGRGQMYFINGFLSGKFVIE